MQLFNSDVNYTFIKQDTQQVLLVKPSSTGVNIFDWLRFNKIEVEKCLLEVGAILFRGFDIYAISEFNKFVQILCPNLFDYIYRSTPRTKLGGKIYTATEYPANRSIPLHNENSYSLAWPSRIFFFSAIVAAEGGETPIADSRKVYERIDPYIREKFEQKGVMYVRNYTAGIDLSWQEVFQTEDKSVVSNYCKNNQIECIWNTYGPELTTKQVCQATLVHPITKERVWFNQAHLFHVSALQDNERMALIEVLGENNLPRNTLYGDGEPISLEIIDHIRDAYQQEVVIFGWEKGDIMMLDNILYAHGRNPYKGDRKVAVAMGGSYT